jgi:hypothetical protein
MQNSIKTDGLPTQMRIFLEQFKSCSWNKNCYSTTYWVGPSPDVSTDALFGEYTKIKTIVPNIMCHNKNVQCIENKCM